jgi:hypothetical protein
MQKPAIKLMPDYHCWPIWHADGHQVGNINPANLGISVNLQEDLSHWAATYDSHLNLNDPTETTWTEKEEKKFDDEGRRLTVELLKEIGSQFTIYYSSSLVPAETLQRTAEQDAAANP